MPINQRMRTELNLSLHDAASNRNGGSESPARCGVGDTIFYFGSWFLSVEIGFIFESLKEAKFPFLHEFLTSETAWEFLNHHTSHKFHT